MASGGTKRHVCRSQEPLAVAGVRLTVPTPESNDVALSAFKRYVGRINQSHMVLCGVMTPAAQLVESIMGEPMA